jgi:polysaccharide export outer membrane protein
LTKYLKGEDLSVNIELQSGDTVVVPQVGMVGTVQVIGEVNKPGQVILNRNMTFREALGITGGVNEMADTGKITIKREGLTDPLSVNYEQAMSGDSTADIALNPGDTIYVPKNENYTFTVMGAVNKPGPYPLKNKLKLSEAIGLAGGAISGGSDLTQVTITRNSENGTSNQTIKVNVDNILQKAAEDPLVRNGDVIYVKERKEKQTPLKLLQSIVPFIWIFRR